MKLRCSALPRICQCPASAVAPEVVLTGGGPEADLGSAFHEAIAVEIHGGELDLEAIAARWRVSDDELRILYYQGRKAWGRLAQFFPDPQVESAGSFGTRDGTELSGTADVVSISPGTDDIAGEIRVLDWKTGHLEPSAEDQLRGYCLVHLALNPDAQIGHFAAAVCLVREGEVVWYRWTAAELLEWWSSLLVSLVDHEARYNPGPHCAYCPRGHECPAKTAELQQSISVLTHADLSTVTPETAGPVYAAMLDRVRLVENLCEKVREQIRVQVLDAGGRMPADAGRELILREQAQRKIDALAGWNLLCDRLGEGVLIENCVDVRKTRVDEIVKANAPRGQKGKAAEALMADLDAVGALRTQYVQRLEIRRVVEPALPESPTPMLVESQS